MIHFVKQTRRCPLTLQSAISSHMTPWIRGLEWCVEGRDHFKDLSSVSRQWQWWGERTWFWMFKCLLPNTPSDKKRDTGPGRARVRTRSHCKLSSRGEVPWALLPSTKIWSQAEKVKCILNNLVNCPPSGWGGGVHNNLPRKWSELQNNTAY